MRASFAEGNDSSAIARDSPTKTFGISNEVLSRGWVFIFDIVINFNSLRLLIELCEDSENLFALHNSLQKFFDAQGLQRVRSFLGI